MRVVQLPNFQRERAGSFIPLLVAIFAEVRERGWHAEAVLFEATRRAAWVHELRDAGAEITFAPQEVEGSRRRRRRWLARELRGRREPLLLHTHFTLWDVPALFAARRERGDVVFWHVHTALSRDPAVVARGLVKFALLGRRVDQILAPAPNIAEGIQRLGAPRDRVHFVPTALDVERFPLLEADRRKSARRQLDLPADAGILLHFGWHFHLKGNDIFLQTLKCLIDEHPERDWLGVSRGGEEDTAALAREMGIGEHLRILPPVPSILTLFGAADVLLSSSREEGMAYAVLESLAIGTPVVATNIPGHAYIGDHVGACRVVARDPGALAAGVIATLERTPQEAMAETEQAREWLGENLSTGRVARRLADMYADAFAATRGDG